VNYDELLAKINKEVEAAEFESTCGDGNDPRVARALREVVKLHKPVACEELDGSQGTMCINCCDGFYPCLTIETIEWNLNELRL
jgi:hypothetical protein